MAKAALCLDCACNTEHVRYGYQPPVDLCPLHREAEAMRQALREILTEFTPTHLDFVSKTKCGTNALAILARIE